MKARIAKIIRAIITVFGLLGVAVIALFYSGMLLWRAGVLKMSEREAGWYSREFSGVSDMQMIIGTKPEPPPELQEAEFNEMIEKGTKAWADVPDATAWVEELRGN